MLMLGRGMAPLRRAADSSLQAVVGSCVFDLDATKAASYPGSGQIWRNVVAAPADGALQTAYDFTLGLDDTVSTDDASFVGVAGGVGAYFLLDGADALRIKGGNTPFLSRLPRTDTPQDFTFAMAFMPADSAGTVNLISNKTGASLSRGVAINISSSERAYLSQGDNTLANSLATDDLTACAVGVPTVVIYSRRGSDGLCRSWVNRLAKFEQTLVYGANAAGAAGTFTIGGSGTTGSGGFLPNGTRVYALSGYSGFIDDAEAARIFATYAIRHGRTYA